MNSQYPAVIEYYVNGITLEICQGKIPDLFRQAYFGPITKFELPDTKVNNDEFDCWLSLYRNSNAWFEQRLLEESKCN